MHQYKLHFLVIFLFTSVPIKALEKHNLNIFFEFPVKNTYEIEFIEDVKLIKIDLLILLVVFFTENLFIKKP